MGLFFMGGYVLFLCGLCPTTVMAFATSRVNGGLTSCRALRGGIRSSRVCHEEDLNGCFVPP